jgi:biopolymer transport protein ExbB
MAIENRLGNVLRALALAAGMALACASPVTAQTGSTEAPATAAAAPGGNAAKNDEASNPYGLRAIVEHGDTVSHGVLGILMIMSLGTWFILVAKLIEQRKLLAEAKSVRPGSGFWSAGSVKQGAESLSEEGAFRFIADTAIEATQRHDGVLAGVDLNSWLTTSLDEAGEEVEHKLQKGLSFLATVGSTSPFIGLFGTVWGILNALTAIGVAGQASIDKVAGPVGEALIMTAIGLAVAVPAVLGYNWLVGRNTAALHHVTTFSSKLRAMMLAAAPAAARA